MVIGRSGRILLEFGFKNPDLGSRLTEEDPNLEPQELDLGESIDALLDEIDSSCAPFDGANAKAKAKKEAEANPGNMAFNDDGTPIEAVESPVNKEAEELIDSASNDESESATEPDAINEPVDETDAGEETLDALESVSKSAESLLEDSISQLLTEHDASQNDESELVEAVDDSVDVEQSDSESAQVIEAPAASAIEEVTEEAVEASFAESVEEASTDDPEGSVDDLLAGIADDLIEEQATTEPENDIEETISEDAVDEDVESAQAEEENTELNAGVVDENELDAAAEDVAEAQVDELSKPELSKPELSKPEESETEVAPLDANESVIEEAVEEEDSDVVTEPVSESVSEGEHEQFPESGVETESPAQAEVSVEETETAELDAPAAEEDMGLGDLDDALASIGDDMLMGDFETGEGDIVDPDSLEGSMDPSALLDQLSISGDCGASSAKSSEPSAPLVEDESPRAVQDSSETPAKTASPQAVDQPKAAGSAQASVQGTQSKSADQLKVPDAAHIDSQVGSPVGSQVGAGIDGLSGQEIESIWQRLGHTAQFYGQMALRFTVEQGGPIAARGVLVVSKPIASKPVALRNAIGYIALWTLFLSVVLWMYVMFFRTTPTPTPSQAPTRVVESGEQLEPVKIEQP
jgi:hypothetical protein